MRYDSTVSFLQPRAAILAAIVSPSAARDFFCPTQGYTANRSLGASH